MLVDGEASCFYHPAKKAVLPCESCGRFLCAVCDVEMNGQHLCPACLASGKKKGRLKQLENRRTLYDSLALGRRRLPDADLALHGDLRADRALHRHPLLESADQRGAAPQMARGARHPHRALPARRLGRHHLRRDALGSAHLIPWPRPRVPTPSSPAAACAVRSLPSAPRAAGSGWLRTTCSPSITPIASEEYRRFYFRDIEAFIIRRTASRQIWNWIFAVLLLITAGPFFLGWRSAGNGGLLITALSFAAFWLLLIVINSARGATCETHIRTAVQTEQLPSLGRLPVARRVLARIQPLIVEAQGAATPEELDDAPWMNADGASSCQASHGTQVRFARRKAGSTARSSRCS